MSASTPACYPPGTFKILEPRTFAGFQFNTSTVLYPEWPVSALPHVDIGTQKAVATALFNLSSLGGNATNAQYLSAASVATFQARGFPLTISVFLVSLSRIVIPRSLRLPSQRPIQSYRALPSRAEALLTLLPPSSSSAPRKL